MGRSVTELAEKGAGMDVRGVILTRGRYRARVYRQGQHFTRSFATVAEAIAWREQTLERLERGEAPEQRPAPAPIVTPDRPDTVTVELAARTLTRGMVAGSVRDRNGRLYKPSACRKYESMLRVHILPRIGAVAVSSIERGDVQRLVDQLAAETSAETARKALVALRVVYRLAERDGLVADDPCRGVRTPAGHTERAARFLTPSESERLIAAAGEIDRERSRSLGEPLLRVALDTGLRLGEILALPWRAVDLNAATITVARSLDREPDKRTGEPVFVPPKTASSRRIVPLTRAAADVLRRHRLASGRRAAGELVFARADGRPLDSYMLPGRTLKAAAERSGVAAPLPRFHDLRHSYATAMLGAGLTAHAVANLLGHSSAQLVFQRYGHALPDELASSASRLEAWREGLAAQ
jgi:integrase